MSSSTKSPSEPETPEGRAPLPPPVMRERTQKADPVLDQEPMEQREAVESQMPPLNDEGKRQASFEAPELSPQNQKNALDWFLSPEPDAATKDLEINVGTEAKPTWITWTIRAIDADQLKAIQRAAEKKARRQRQGEVDEVDSMLAVMVEGTVYPPLRDIAAQEGERDVRAMVRKRFARKPGLIPMVSGEIFKLSGFDEADVREADAAGN